MNEFDFARAYLGQFKVKGDEIVPRFCPFCKGGAHHDKETFALNHRLHVYKCQRGSCGAQGHFSRLCERFGAEADRAGPFPARQFRPRYKRPQAAVEPPTDAVREYLFSRGILPETAAAFGIGSRGGNILFPYYRTPEEAAAKTPTFVKYRAPRPLSPGERKMWRDAGTEPVLFGMHLCDERDPTLCLFEGEFDCMSAYQVTKRNCVSIPSGCQDFTWLDTCYDWLRQFDTVAVAADNDPPGRKMLEELTRKLDCKLLRPDFTLYGPHKDANEILTAQGGEALARVLASMRPVPVQGLLNLAQVECPDIMQIPHVQSGITALDKMTGGLFYGDLSVWTGKRGEGKSTLLSQLLLDSLRQDVNVCAYSGEMPANRLKYIANLQAAGPAYVRLRADEATGREISYLPQATRAAVEGWYNGRFWLYDNHALQEADETDTILRLFELAYRRYDCRVFLVDNLMTVASAARERDALQQQADFAVRLRRLAERLGVHVHLVAHPRKTDGPITDSDAVSGLSAVTNIASNVFSIHRCTPGEEQAFACDTLLSCLKNRMFGDLGRVRLQYDKRCRRFLEAGCEPVDYGWLHTDPSEPGEDDLPF